MAIGFGAGAIAGELYYLSEVLAGNLCFNWAYAIMYPLFGGMLGSIIAPLLFGGYMAGAAMGWWGQIGTATITAAAGSKPSVLANLSRLPGATASQIRAMIPKGWIGSYNPFFDRFGKYIQQVIYTSPNGLEQLRIHSPMTGYGSSWVARWSVQVSEDFYKALPQANDWISKFGNTYWANLSNLHIWVPVQSDAAHIPVIINDLSALLSR
jgi:hypothetical protein